jgi:dihydroorotate dehydrogenase electron transfer subunit
MIQMPVIVIENREVSSDIFLMSLESTATAFSAQPGQFLMVLCGEDNLLRRPLGIHQYNKKTGEFSLLYSIVGKGTHWLSRREKGDIIDILGPLGKGFTIYPDTKDILLIAGGMGIAPLFFLANEAHQKGYQVTLLIGARNSAQLPEHALKLPVKTITATEDGSSGRRGMITEYIAEYVDSADQIFTCGPLPMYRTLNNMPILDNKPTQISLESRMGCGVGVCYGCTVRTSNGLKQVCKDGPVFDLKDIIWDEFICD